MSSEIRQTRKTTTICVVYVVLSVVSKQINKLADTGEQTGGCRRQGVRVDEMCEGNEKTQTSSYKMNKSWECNV